MFRFIARRLLETIPVLFIIVTATFFMVRFVPGGPFDSEKATTPEIRANLEAYYGLNLPLHQQYLNYLKAVVLHGDLGRSTKYASRTVNEIIADKLPASLQLGSLALLIALVLGLTAGVVAAVNRNTKLDYFTSTFAMVGIR
jgi:oligopeptide transport system permease protein